MGGGDNGSLPKMDLHKVQKLDDSPGVKGRIYQQGRKTEIVGGEMHAGPSGICLPGTELLQSPFRTGSPWGHVRGDIDDPCGTIADFCGVIADRPDPCPLWK